MKSIRIMSHLKMKIAKLFLVSVPSLLSKPLLLPYYKYLAKVRRLQGVAKPIKQIERDRKENYRITFYSGPTILVPQIERVSRFVSGYERAIQRIFSQYKIAELENFDFETIIDVGANVGEFSLAMLNFYQTRVIAVEPVDRTFHCLKENLAAFSNRSECFNLALSNNEEETNFFIAEDLENSSFIRPEVFQSQRVVHTETLEKFLERRNIEKVDLLKMDAEGFEPEVLSGLGRHLSRILNFTIDCSPERLGKSTTNEVRQFFVLNQIPYREFTDKESGRVILVGGKNLKVD